MNRGGFPPIEPGVVVLDGGLSTVLASRGCDLSTELWTASLLRDSPADIVAAHVAYFEAGADVATAASYQTSVEGFIRAGIAAAEARALMRSSVELARQAQAFAAPDRRTWVAASVGPYGATLADGSEYRGQYAISDQELRGFHRSRLELLADAGPDLFAVETIPDVREAEILIPLLDEIGLPAWFSYSVVDGRTAAGQSLDEAFGVVAGSASVVAAGVNCCAPHEVLPALAAVRDAGIVASVAYPNQGRVWDSESHTWIGSGAYDVAAVLDWTAAGVRLVGGCCEVGPSTIAGVAAIVHA